MVGRAGPVLGPCWAVLCRAEPLNGPQSTPAAHPGPFQVAGLKGYLLLGSWGPQRGRAASGAPRIGVQLGRGPHGQCPGSARPSCTARPQLPAVSCWWPMASSSMLFLQRSGVLGPAWAPSSLLGCQQRLRAARGEAGQDAGTQGPTFTILLRPFRAVSPDEGPRPRQAAQGPSRAAPCSGAAAGAPPAPELGDSWGCPGRTSRCHRVQPPVRRPLARGERRQETHRAARPVGRGAGAPFRNLGGPVCRPRPTDAEGPRAGPGRPG
jgi:hypothetical protein